LALAPRQQSVAVPLRWACAWSVRWIHVVKVAGGRRLLIGATPTPSTCSPISQRAADQTPEASSFFDLLKSNLAWLVQWRRA
jgi:hypothetical protein